MSMDRDDAAQKMLDTLLAAGHSRDSAGELVKAAFGIDLALLTIPAAQERRDAEQQRQGVEAESVGDPDEAERQLTEWQHQHPPQPGSSLTGKDMDVFSVVEKQAMLEQWVQDGRIDEAAAQAYADAWKVERPLPLPDGLPIQEVTSAQLALRPEEAHAIVRALAIQNVQLQRDIQRVQSEGEALGMDFAEVATTSESLDAQIQIERTRAITCPHCGVAITAKDRKVEYPKYLFHPVQEPRRVENAAEHKQLGRQWREKPWRNESAERILSKEVNDRTNAEEARMDDEARHKAGLHERPDWNRGLPPARGRKLLK